MARKMLRKRGTAKIRRLKSQGCRSRDVRYMWLGLRVERNVWRVGGAGTKGVGIEVGGAMVDAVGWREDLAVRLGLAIAEDAIKTPACCLYSELKNIQRRDSGTQINRQ